MNIVVQILGFFALLISVLSYQRKNKKSFLYMQILTSILYMVQYIILGANSAVLVVFIAIARLLIFLQYEKSNKEIPIIWLIIFIVATIVAGICTYSGTILSIIPIIIGCIFTYGTWQKNLKVTYFIGIIVSILWCIYNGGVGAYVASISSILELASSSMGLVKLDKSSH